MASHHAACSLFLSFVLPRVSCCHYHQESFAAAVARAQAEITRQGTLGGAVAAGTVLRAPGSADGKLPTSLMFRALDMQSVSFFNAAGVLSNPIQAEHVVAKTVNGLHMATIVPGATRGNHMHDHTKEVLVLVHGKFLLRVAMVGNDGKWVSEDHFFEIGLPPSPFDSVDSVVSSVPIGMEIPPHVCHALKNLDTQTTSFIASYFVAGMQDKREEPQRDVCRKQKIAFLE